MERRRRCWDGRASLKRRETVGFCGQPTTEANFLGKWITALIPKYSPEIKEPTDESRFEVGLGRQQIAAFRRKFL